MDQEDEEATTITTQNRQELSGDEMPQEENAVRDRQESITPYQRPAAATTTTPRTPGRIPSKHHEIYWQKTTLETTPAFNEDFGDLLLIKRTEAEESTNSTCSVDRRRHNHLSTSSMLNYKSKGNNNSPTNRLGPSSVMSVFASVSSKREQLFSSSEHQPFTSQTSGKLDATEPVHNVAINPVNTLAIGVSNQDRRSCSSSSSDTCLRASTSPPTEEVQEEPDKYPCLRRALSCTETPILPLGTYAVEFGFDVSTLPFTPMRQPLYNRPEMATVGGTPSLNYRINPGLSKAILTTPPSVQSVHTSPFPTKVHCASATGREPLLRARISKATMTTSSRTFNRDDSDVVDTSRLPLATATCESLPCCSGWHDSSTQQTSQQYCPKNGSGVGGSGSSSTTQSMNSSTNNMGKAESCGIITRDSLEHSLLVHGHRPPVTNPAFRPGEIQTVVAAASDNLIQQNWSKGVYPSSESICAPSLDVATARRVEQRHHGQVGTDSTNVGQASTQWKEPKDAQYAMVWKKDKRTWLWKSTSRKRHRLDNYVVAKHWKKDNRTWLWKSNP